MQKHSSSSVVFMFVLMTFVMMAGTQILGASPGSQDVKATYPFDARGPLCAQDIRHSKQDRIQIDITNKNPFLYDYTITLKSEIVAEPALAAFLPLLGGPIPGFFSAQPEGEKTSQALQRKATPPQLCQGDQGYNQFLESSSKLVEEVNALETYLTNMKKNMDSVLRDYGNSKKKLENPGADFVELNTEATQLISKLSDYAANSFEKDFDEKIDQMKRHADVLMYEADNLNTRIPNCPGVETCQSYARLIADKVTDDYLKTFKEIVKKRQELDEAAQSIASVLKSSTAFKQSIMLGPFHDPTSVTIKVERKLKQPGGKEAKSETIVEVKAEFGGGQRFTLAAGLALTNLEKFEFQRVQQPGSETTIVGLKENSALRVMPLIMLHTRLYEIDSSWLDGLHLSVGITAKNDNQGTDVEYLLGLSLSFIEQRLFLTGGTYAGRQQRLEGGFQVGSPITNDTAEIPVRKEYHWKTGFAITYKIK